MQEDNALPFLGNWDGTGVIEGVNDAERIGLDMSQYMSSGVVETSLRTVELLTNNYGSGDTVALRYRHGATVADCEAAAWIDYTVPFNSLGYVQVRIEPSLWYLLGGIATANARQVYDSKNAASLANSYLNIAESYIGTYDLATGDAPGWSAGVGWDFDVAATNWLRVSSGVGVILKPGTIIARIIPGSAGTVRYILAGAGNAALSLFLNASNIMVLGRTGYGNIATATTPITTEKVVAVTYDASGNYAFYINGVSDGSGTSDQSITTDSDQVGRERTGVEYMDGIIPQLITYDTVLTPTQVALVSAAVLLL